MSAINIEHQPTANRRNRLIDRFGRTHTYLRISVTDRCNLRCAYCMPPEGLPWKSRSELLSFEEIVRVARVFVAMGIDKIRITGGEPLVRQNLDTLLEQLNRLPGLNTLAITTNGLLLENQAERLKAAGVRAINISLDTLRPDRFQQIAKRDSFHAVMAGIEAALAVGFDTLKLNVVVMAGVNEDEILDFVEFTRNKPMNVRFIEYMPFKDNAWTEAGVFPYLSMRRLVENQYALTPLPAGFGAVAKDFAIAGSFGTVSFITSMTDSFCSACNRLRLTADGRIKACLFQPAEVNIRDPLRNGLSDEGLETLMKTAVSEKQEAHPSMEELLTLENRAMIEIGG